MKSLRELALDCIVGDIFDSEEDVREVATHFGRTGFYCDLYSYDVEKIARLIVAALDSEAA